jgi:hypothetical protein
MGRRRMDFWTKWFEGLLLEVLVYRAALVVGRIVSSTEDTADITRSSLAGALGCRMGAGALDASGF